MRTITINKNKLLFQKIFKFAVVGGTAFIFDAGGYFVLTRHGHLQYLLARIISMTFSLCYNFFLNRYWTFSAQEGSISRQMTRFIIVMTATSLLSIGLMKIGVGKLNLPDMSTLIVISIFISAINFIAHRRWSYHTA